LVFFIVFGLNLDALVTLSKNSDDLKEGQNWIPQTSSLKGLTEYIGANPKRVSLVSRSGTNPDTTIYYGADKPHTMGTLSNFFLIATYARLVESDSLDPNQPISFEKTDRYQLPYTNSSNHSEAKNAMKSSDDYLGNHKVPLHTLIQNMIIYNDLAISDFLYYKLGRAKIQQTYQLLSIKHTDQPLPFFGLYITLNPVLINTSFASHFKMLQELSEPEFRKKVLTNAHHFINDTAYRAKVVQSFSDTKGWPMEFTKRRDALSLFPQTTAHELSDLMIRLQQDSLISPKASQRIKDLMDWPYKRQRLERNLASYGALYDNRLGLTNGIDYGRSIYTHEPFGQAIFFDSLQVAFWFHMSSSGMHQDYQQRLIWDPALRESTTREVNRTNNTYESL